MSDTPLDQSLDNKSSMRMPEWLADRVETFTEQYNDAVRSREDIDDPERFLLDSNSVTHRRLIDIGLWAWGAKKKPAGFGFEGAEGLTCPQCGTEDVLSFRVGPEGESDSDFARVACTRCGETGEREHFVAPSSDFASWFADDEGEAAE